jgi:hypothetical protein
MLARQTLLQLEPLRQPFCFFQDRVFQTICLGFALNQDPPDLGFVSS